MQSNISTNHVKLPFGLKDGELVHISQVSSGLACNCYCASCNTRLIAKKGKKNAHGFSHYKSDECAHAFETTLHYLAKKVLEESAEINLPELKIQEQLYGEICGQSIYKSGSAIVCPEHIAIVEDIKLEKPLDQIVPDVIATINGSRFLIEVAVTHFIDEIKEQKITNLNLPCIEIDLSNMVRDADLAQIHKEVVDSIINKKWIYHPGTKAVRKTLKSELQLKLQKELDQIFEKEQERKRIANEIRQKQITEKRATLEKLQPSIRLLENYQKDKEKHLLDYSQRLPGLSIWQRAVSTMNISTRTVPDFLNQPIKGESIFACDRRAWQSALFTVFIYGKFSKFDDPHPISVYKMVEWCKSYVPLNKFVFNLWSNKGLLESELLSKLYNFDLYTAVREFARHLEKKGFIAFHYQDLYKIENDHLSLHKVNIVEATPRLTGISMSQYNLLFKDEQEAFEEKAGILEFCNGLSRKNAERKAYELVLAI